MRWWIGLVVAAGCAGGPADKAADTDTDGDTGGLDSVPVDSGDTGDGAPTTCVSTNEADDDGDGAIDRAYVVTSVGATRSTLIDADGDGVDDRRQDFVYTDAQHTIILERTTYALPSEEVLSTQRGTLDDKGRLARREEDFDADGTLERDTTTTWGDGEEEYDQLVEEDLDDDGAVDSRATRTQDAQGRVTRVTYDDDADGVLEQVEVWAYDGLVTVYQRFEPEGELLEGLRVTVNAAGDTTMEEVDQDGDGTYASKGDTVMRITYRPDGQPDVTEQDGVGGDAPDDVWDLRTTRRYDDAGLLLQVEDSRAGAGVVGRTTYTYNAAGYRLSREDDLDGDGTILSGEVYTVDDEGNVLTVTVLEGGEPTSRSTYTWEDGRETSYTFDAFADGIPDRVRTTVYDPYGRVTEARLDRDGDGTWDYTERWTFSCAPQPGEGPRR